MSLSKSEKTYTEEELLTIIQINRNIIKMLFDSLEHYCTNNYETVNGVRQLPKTAYNIHLRGLRFKVLQQFDVILTMPKNQ